MKLWIDDVRMAPDGYIWAKSVYAAKEEIINSELQGTPYTLINIDHNAGEYLSEGGNYIRLLEWFEETGRKYPIHIHAVNRAAVKNMRQIIQRNGWREV